MAEPETRTEPQDKPLVPTGPKVITAEQIFGDRREVWIQHAGVRYRLRITRRNKLILQK